MPAELVLVLLLIGAAAALGLFISRQLLGGEHLLTQLALSFPLGAGLWTWHVFLLGWLGFPVTAITYLAAALFVLTFWLVLRNLGIGGNGAFSEWRSGRGELVAILALAALAFTVLGWLAVARSYSTWDAMAIWSVKGYGIVHEGSISAAAEWGSHGLSYPLQLPLLIGAFRLVTGDLLPGSKLVFPVYYLSLLLGVYAYTRRRGLSWPWAAAGTMVVGSVPLVLEHATIGYANLPLTTLLLLGTLTFLGADERPGSLLISGILLGLAAWVRPEALFLVVAGIIALALAARLGPRRRIAWAPWILPVVLIGASWFAFNLIHGVTGVFGDSLRAGSASLLAMDLNPGGAYRVLRFVAGQYVSPEVWGLAAPLTGLLALLSWRRLGPSREPHAFSLLLIALAWGVPVVMFYYLLSFRPDLDYWLGTGIDRLMMPATVAALLWGLRLALPADRIQPGPGATADEPASDREGGCERHSAQERGYQ